MLNDLSFLEVGSDWLPSEERSRIALYELNSALYENDHLAILDTLLKTVYPEQEINETVKRVFVNLYRGVSKLWADLLFSEKPTISQADKTSEDYLNELIKKSRFWRTAKKVAIDVSRYGNGLFKVRTVKGEAVIEPVTPRIWFPVVSPDNVNNILYHVIAYSFVENKVQYLKVEIHEIGKITHKLFIIDKDANKIKEEIALDTLDRYKGIEAVETTNADDFLIIPVCNSSCSEHIFGEDDYTDINPLVSQIELHLSKCGKDLEEQGNIKYGPGTAIDENGNIQKNGYIPMLGGANKTDPPGVVAWTVQIEAIKEYIAQLMFFFYMVGNISPVLFDPNQTIASNISGVAMKRLMQRMVHEFGHSLDIGIMKASTKGFSHYSKELQKIIEQNRIKRIDKFPETVKAKFIEIQKKTIRSNGTIDFKERRQWGAVNDIYDALCNGNLHKQPFSMYGHGTKYYRQQGTKELEIFANYVQLRLQNKTEQLNFLKENSPELLKSLENLFTMYVKDIKKL